MQLNTGKNNIFDFTDEEKLEIEGNILNHRVVQVIKELMAMNDIKTKKDLAEKAGVSGAYISKVFRSDKNFNVPFLVKLQRVFNTTFTFSAKSIQENEMNIYINEFQKILIQHEDEAKVIPIKSVPAFDLKSEAKTNTQYYDTYVCQD